MNDIEQKALALLNESGWKGAYLKRAWNCRYEALCRAIEQHEAFRREVSDAVVRFYDVYGSNSIAPPWSMVCRIFDGFIIPPPVDPLAEVVNEAWGWRNPHPDVTDNLRAAMKARGYEFMKIGEGA